MKGRPWLTPLVEQRFRRDWRDGVPTADIAKGLGLSPSGAAKLARECGLPPRTHQQASAELSGGRWVRRGLIEVWVDDLTAS